MQAGGWKPGQYSDPSRVGSSDKLGSDGDTSGVDTNDEALATVDKQVTGGSGSNTTPRTRRGRRAPPEFSATSDSEALARLMGERLMLASAGSKEEAVLLQLQSMIDNPDAPLPEGFDRSNFQQRAENWLMGQDRTFITEFGDKVLGGSDLVDVSTPSSTSAEAAPKQSRLGSWVRRAAKAMKIDEELATPIAKHADKLSVDALRSAIGGDKTAPPLSGEVAGFLEDIDSLEEAVHFDILGENREMIGATRAEINGLLDALGKEDMGYQNDSGDIVPLKLNLGSDVINAWQIDDVSNLPDDEVIRLGSGDRDPPFELTGAEIKQLIASGKVRFSKKHGLKAKQLHKMLNSGAEPSKGEYVYARDRCVGGDVVFTRDSHGRPIGREAGSPLQITRMYTTNAPNIGYGSPDEQEEFIASEEVFDSGGFVAGCTKEIEKHLQDCQANGTNPVFTLPGIENMERMTAEKVRSQFIHALVQELEIGAYSFESITFTHPNPRIEAELAQSYDIKTRSKEYDGFPSLKDPEESDADKAASGLPEDMSAHYTPAVLKAEAYKAECRDKVRMFLKSCKKDGVKVPVMTAIGLGTFMKPALRAEAAGILAEAFAEELATGKYPFEAVVFSTPNTEVTDAFERKLEEMNVKDNPRVPIVKISNKSAIDIGRHAAKKGILPGVLNAGDPSCVAGQNYNSGHVALEEMLALFSTLLLSQHPGASENVRDASKYETI